MEWVRETGLGANLWKDEMERLDFAAESNNISDAETKTTRGGNAAHDDWMVTIQPMEIRTFVMKVVFD